MLKQPDCGPGKWHHFLDVPNVRWYPSVKCSDDKTCKYCYDQRPGVKELNKDASNWRIVLQSISPTRTCSLGGAYNANRSLNQNFPKSESHPELNIFGKEKIPEKYISKTMAIEKKIAEHHESIGNEEVKKRGRGRPKKYKDVEPILETVETPTVVPIDAQVPVADEKPNVSRKKYGNLTEVYNGLFPQTKSGLTKDDLVKTPKGRIVSKKQAENLKTAVDRLKNLKTQKEV